MALVFGTRKFSTCFSVWPAFTSSHWPISVCVWPIPNGISHKTHAGQWFKNCLQVTRFWRKWIQIPFQLPIHVLLRSYCLVYCTRTHNNWRNDGHTSTSFDEPWTSSRLFFAPPSSAVFSIVYSVFIHIWNWRFYWPGLILCVTHMCVLRTDS